HVRISSPQVVSPCFYGIDMAHEDDLVASARPVEEVRRYIGATSLAHLSVEGMQWATKLPSKDVCRACFTGDYPAAVPDGLRADKLRFEPAGVTS
ncbi:MAG: amidophosphoribosyltransferase, partial [Gaiella sp.]